MNTQPLLDKQNQKITLCPDDISDELYSALDDAFSDVLKAHGINPDSVFWDKWYLTATYEIYEQEVNK